MAADSSQPKSHLQEYHTSSATGSTLGFETIPPERIGLNGEYDHDGLAKRCQLALETQFPCEEIQHLSVHQRGAVITLIGQVPSQGMLDQIVAIALSTPGAQDVEINGINILPTSIRAS